MSPPKPSTSSLPISQKLLQLAQTAQFVWWIGHLFTVFFGTLYYLRFLSASGANRYYYLSVMGALFSYGISVYKTYGPPQFTLPFLQRLIIDENVQYIILAVFLYTQRPIFVALVPFLIFSVFHASGYLRLTLIPAIYPTVSVEIENAKRAGSTSTTSLTFPAKVSMFLMSSFTNYYSSALKLVSLWEVSVIMVWVTLFALTFRISLFFPIVYAQFLRIRYVTSPPVRAAFHTIRTYLDSKIIGPNASQSIPPTLAQYYVKCRDYLVNMGNNIVNQANQPQPTQ
ncbi:hypothetical protein BB561_001308 [Smittium simulii]|uniref:Nucleoporin POM33 n=1 Tax=Smittium simulii TaxID=133385 RepID=A0A2T9YV96_9FUNG|nr:hypothetical protein BB561_001308 [Smittium simulii]